MYLLDYVFPIIKFLIHFYEKHHQDIYNYNVCNVLYKIHMVSCNQYNLLNQFFNTIYKFKYDAKHIHIKYGTNK